MVKWYDLIKIYFKYTNIWKDIKQIWMAVISAWLDLWSFIVFCDSFLFYFLNVYEVLRWLSSVTQPRYNKRNKFRGQAKFDFGYEKFDKLVRYADENFQ